MYTDTHTHTHKNITHRKARSRYIVDRLPFCSFGTEISLKESQNDRSGDIPEGKSK
jgi:hypothetical protein